MHRIGFPYLDPIKIALLVVRHHLNVGMGHSLGDWTKAVGIEERIKFAEERFLFRCVGSFVLAEPEEEINGGFYGACLG